MAPTRMIDSSKVGREAQRQIFEQQDVVSTAENMLVAKLMTLVCENTDKGHGTSKILYVCALKRYYMCVLLCKCMCLHTTICILMLLFICPHTTMYVSSSCTSEVTRA